MLQRFAVFSSDGRHSPVGVDLEPGHRLGDLAGALGWDELHGPDGRFDLTVEFGESTLSSGSLIAPSSFSRPVTDAPEAGWHLLINEGRLDGSTVGLQPGRFTIGRSDSADVTVNDQRASSIHAELNHSDLGWEVTDLGSTNGVELADEVITDATRLLKPGERFALGMTTFSLAPVPGTMRTTAAAVGGELTNDDLSTEPAAQRLSDQLFFDGTTIYRKGPGPTWRPADIRRGRDGRLLYNRPGRSRRSLDLVEVAFEPEPKQRSRESIPWVELLLPLVAAMALAVVFSQPRYLMFGILGPVMGLARFMSSRKRRKVSQAEAEGVWRQQTDEAVALLASSAATESAYLNHHSPWLSDVIELATRRSDRLWERRFQDPDFLQVRVGSAHMPGSTKIVGPVPDDVELDLPLAPVTVNLREVGVLGVVSADTNHGRRVAGAMICQISGLHSPRDLRLWLLTEPNAESSWRWFHWLPHTHALDHDGTTPAARVGNRPETTTARIAELRSLVDARLAADARAAIRPAIVVILDGARSLRDQPGLPSLLRDGPTVGVYFIAIDQSTGLLPDEARARVVAEPGTGSGSVEIDGKHHFDKVVVDAAPDLGRLDRLARSTTGLTEIRGDTGDELPESVRLTEVLNTISQDEYAAAKSRWRSITAKPSTEATVGVDRDGPFTVGFGQQAPHALVAGTSGAGKSQLVLTFLYGLCRNNRPDQLGLIVIDYKGGGDYVDLVGLPHFVGMVTQVEPSQAARVVRSLEAEIDRRTSVLRQMREAGQISSADVSTAWRESPEAAQRGGLGRLVIMVDEFAQLRKKSPEFIDRLVSVTRVGRSIGIHLVLATQRPAGQVSDDIRANTGLRLVLRTESGESRDVLGSDHSDHISPGTPGRGWVAVREPTKRLVEFQTATVGLPSREGSNALAPPTCHYLDWH